MASFVCLMFDEAREIILGIIVVVWKMNKS